MGVKGKSNRGHHGAIIRVAKRVPVFTAYYSEACLVGEERVSSHSF